MMGHAQTFSIFIAALVALAACGEDGPDGANVGGYEGGRAGGAGGPLAGAAGAEAGSGGSGGSGGAEAGSGGSSAGGGPPTPGWRVDAAFGEGGLLGLGELGVSALPPDAATLPGGGFVVLNRERRWVSRFTPEGRRDDAFGWDGVYTFAFSSLEPDALLVLRDGRIVVGGHTDLYSYPPRGMVARLSDRGELDVGFGTDGFADLLEESPQRPRLAGLAEQPDGKIVGTGGYDFGAGMVMFRLTQGGALDLSFNNSGLDVLYGVSLGGGRALELRAGSAVFPTLDGTLVAAGLGVVREADFTTPLGTDFVLFRRLAFGGVDYEFGQGGLLAADAGPSSAGGFDPGRYENRCIFTARLADGRVVIAGERGFEQPDLVVARFLPDGAPDPSFANGAFFAYAGLGVVNGSAGPCSLSGLAVAPDGSALLAGEALDAQPYYGNRRGLLLRLLPDGRPDPAFGNGGAMYPELGVRIDTNGDGTLDGETTYHPPFTSLVALGDGSYLVGARPYDGSGYKFFRLLPP